MECVNLVHEALANDRLELFAQRILGLDENSEKMHFEILVRIKNIKGESFSAKDSEGKRAVTFACSALASEGSRWRASRKRADSPSLVR